MIPPLSSLDLRAVTDTLRRWMAGLDAWARSLGTASALNADADAALTANSDQVLPTQKAVKAYADAITAAVGAGYQPLDSDLTAIAALTTTPFGRALLTEASATSLVGTLGLAALYQPLDSDLTAIAALSTTAFGRALLTETNAASVIATLGLGSIYQPLDSDLTAVAGLGTTGLVTRTGAGTMATRTLTGPAAGFTITDGNGVSGNPTFVLADDLAAVEGLSGTGMASRTAANTWALRQIAGTANEIGVTDGTGAAGNPTISLPTNITLTGKNITGGTFTGITDLAVADGGTGASSASGARTNLGLVIGTHVQAWDADLDIWATKTAPSGTVVGHNDSQTLTNKTFDASNNTLSNLTVSMFAANVVDTDAALTANSHTRLPSQAAVKSYVDNLITGLKWKTSAKVATTGNITLSGTQTIDGIAITVGNRVLVKDQTAGAENGIYICAAGAWSRAEDADSNAELIQATLFVQRGLVNSDTQWTCTNDITITFGTTVVVFAQVSGAGTYSAGTGLSLSGNQFSIADSELLALAGLTSAADRLPYFTGSGTAALTTLTSFGRSLIDDADASTARTTLGLGTAATHNTGTSGANVPLLNGNNTWSGTATFSASVDQSGAPFTITYGVAGAGLHLDAVAGTARFIEFETAGANRWLLGVTSTAESGSNAGSDFALACYTDAGSALFTALSIVRSTGVTTIRELGLTTDLDVTHGGTGASSASAARTNLGLAIGSDVQAYGALLDGLTALATTGHIVRTGAGTVAARTLTAPAAGISVSNGDGVSGNPTLALANDLAALEAMSGTGIVARTGSETYAQRTITGTANEISVANGDGVSGNPVVSIAPTFAHDAPPSAFKGRTPPSPALIRSPKAAWGVHEFAAGTVEMAKDPAVASWNAAFVEAFTSGETNFDILDGLYPFRDDLGPGHASVFEKDQSIIVKAGGNAHFIVGAELEGTSGAILAFLTETPPTSDDENVYGLWWQGGYFTNQLAGRTGLYGPTFFDISYTSYRISKAVFNGGRTTPVSGNAAGAGNMDSAIVDHQCVIGLGEDCTFIGFPDTAIYPSGPGVTDIPSVNAYNYASKFYSRRNLFLHCNKGINSKRNHGLVDVDGDRYMNCVWGVFSSGVDNESNKGWNFRIRNSEFKRIQGDALRLSGRAEVYGNLFEDWSRSLIDGTTLVPGSGDSPYAAIKLRGCTDAKIFANTMRMEEWAGGDYSASISRAPTAIVAESVTDDSGEVDAGDILYATTGMRAWKNTIQGVHRIFHEHDSDCDDNIVEDAELATGTTYESVLEGESSYVLYRRNQPVKSLPSTVTLTADDSGKVYRNVGATTLVSYTLPDIGLGSMEFEFHVTDPDGLRVYASTGQTIRQGADVSASGGYFKSITVGSILRLKAIGGSSWYAETVGVWSIDNVIPLPSVAGCNQLSNAKFDVWQRGATFSPSSTVKTKIADLWYSYRSAANHTVERQTGFGGARYCLRATKTGGTSTAGISIGQQIESAVASHLAGKTVTVSWDMRRGSSWDGTGVTPQLVSGAGIDETYTPSTNTFVSTTTATSFSTVALASIGTTHDRYSSSITVPSDCTEAVLRFAIAHSSTTGDASHYIEITNVKLEIGSTATRYEPEPLALTMEQCLRRFQKSFLQATAPAQNVGAGTGELIGRAQVAGAAVNRLPRVQFVVPMRVAPSITFYSPSAATAQAYDATAAAGCTATTAGNITEQGFGIVATGAAGTTAHTNDLSVHWTADGEFA